VCSDFLLVDRRSRTRFDNTDHDLPDYPLIQHQPTGEEVGHGVSYIPLKLAGLNAHEILFLQHGSTVVRLDCTGRSSIHCLRLENDIRIMSWSKASWSALGAVGDGNSVVFADYSFGSTSNAWISSALIGHYQAGIVNKIDESDDGFVDLTTIRDVSVGCNIPVDYSVLTKVHRMGKLSGNRHALTLTIGNVGLSDDYCLVFFMPETQLRIWLRCLEGLVRAVQMLHRRQPDRRIPWLKEQYLSLYYEGSRCVGPTSAEAIKVSYRILKIRELFM